jgi:hypothetical protein
MAKVSKTSAERIQDYGPVLEKSGDIEGYTVNFVDFRDASDITEILASLPEGKCTCPHWGYVLQGQVTVAYDTGEKEIIDAGEAFYLPPGHTSWKAVAGTELLQFSPADELAEVDAAIAAAMQQQA